MKPCWFHIDMDAFFASIEQLDNPELRGRPVIVGATPGHRGVVSTCSYEARVFGVHSAMPSSLAARLCPQGIFVYPRMHRYQELSGRIMEVFSRFTPRLIQVSVDEAYLDLTGTERLLGAPEAIAAVIKSTIRSEIGLTLSIGIAPNKLLAKIASGYKKPDGLTLITEDQIDSFVASLPLAKLWGLGKKTLERLERLGIRDVLTLRSIPLPVLRGTFGQSGGEFLYKVCRGQDPGLYDSITSNHSLSNETTYEDDVDDPRVLEETLFGLSHGLMFRLLSEQGESRTLGLKLRNASFETINVQKTIVHPFQSIEETFEMGKKLLYQRWDKRTPIRLIGLGYQDVQPIGARQQDLFNGSDERRAAVEKAVLGLQAKYDPSVIRKARLVDKPDGKNSNRQE